jgi:restriction endonuclease Mrr
MDKGRRFEGIVADLYRVMGFAVERRKLMVGASGATHEIDVYAKADGPYGSDDYRRICAECKYKGGKEKVAKGEISEFIVKVDDLGIMDRHFFTNSRFTANAKMSAKSYGIELVDGQRLRAVLSKAGLEGRLSSLERYRPNPIMKIARKVMKR